MNGLLRRAALAVATAGAALGLTAVAAPAHAADFADCPALPAGAEASAWTCYEFTASDTLLRFNSMSAHTTAPVTLTLAQGPLNGATVAKAGLIRSGPIPFVTGIPGTPAEIPHPTGWKVQISLTGLVEPGLLVPHKVGLAAKITGPNLGTGCSIGSAARPVVVDPAVQWALPTFTGTYMLAYDDIFALPTATGCNGNDFTVNQLIGLPANATSNHWQVNWVLRTRNY